MRVIRVERSVREIRKIKRKKKEKRNVGMNRQEYRRSAYQVYFTLWAATRQEEEETTAQTR